MGDFRRLRAWHYAQRFAAETFRVSDRMPPEERFGLKAQIRKAAASVPANLAEGVGRGSGASLRHFARIARGSLNEVVSHLELAAEVGLLPMAAVAPVVALATELGPMLSGLAGEIRRRKA